MPRKSSKRHEAPQSKHVRGASVFGKTRKKKRGANAKESLEELFGVEPFLRNEITLPEINKLRSMIDSKGIMATAAEVNLEKATLLTVTSGFGHRLKPKTAERLREFLRK